ncbi:MAG: DUF2132 domain-containing protein [Pseudomonadales bacterium]|jgi:uncharacterized protein (DUF2132 family)|nr:DUF2132 domain-containing protein [Gammaproteobacteria bacterium]MBP6050419.1 DUF2132 domain-containing protein [Pseudomonadales bacterium]MBK6583662.1 DUF2132 domain-containing protein [Gammaproteobacteria bacterium]MBK7169832.1 DUF2132 domain-containing protein [Gammaproteobacteria bacterium]MBK8309293.1 DUF2132 domain-containing protein [Gammaproteobacteria bacterium]
MNDRQPRNPLHGITLEQIVSALVDHYGWDALAGKINLNCFRNDPSVRSSLKFLRKTPWAREKVEQLYISTFLRRNRPRGAE